MLAHGVHYALVVAGLAGLGSLLAPTLERPARLRTRLDPHDLRVDGLRAAVDRYAAGGPVTTLLDREAPAPGRGAEPGSPLLLPLAVVGCVAAAGIHAAMVPPHLRELPLFGAFFLACAVLQLAWAERAVRRPTPRWLALGVAGNLAVVALWAATRLSGLEPVGPWDLACAAGELVAAAACLAAVRRSDVRRVARWSDWHPAAHAWCALTGAVLVLLSTSGAGG